MKYVKNNIVYEFNSFTKYCEIPPFWIGFVIISLPMNYFQFWS